MPTPNLPAALPAATVLDLEGRSVAIGDLYRDRTQVICFLRHFG